MSTPRFPVTFKLRDQSGSPVVLSDDVELRVVQVDETGVPSNSLPIDFALNPPAPSETAPTTEVVSMVDHRISEEKELTLAATATALGRAYLDPDTFKCEVHVEDESKSVSSLQVTTTKIPIEEHGVAVRNTTTSVDLTEGVHYTVSYVTGVVTFTSGVSEGDGVDLDYRWLAQEKWIFHDDEAQTIAGDAITLDNTPVEAKNVAIYNVTQSKALEEGVDYTVNYVTSVVSFTGANYSNGDSVTCDYYQLDPTSDFNVSYVEPTGAIFTRMTLGNDKITVYMDWIFQPGNYIYELDLSGYPDGRYLIDVCYSKGGIVRTGGFQLVVRQGMSLDDLLGNEHGNGLRLVRFKTRRNTEAQEIIGDVLISIHDSEGSQVILQSRTGVDDGEVTINLPEGTYQIGAFKPLVSFGALSTITVIASESVQEFTVLGDLLSAPVVSPAPGCIRVYGNVSSLDCLPAEGVTVRARIKRPPSVVGQTAILHLPDVCVQTDAEGNFTMELMQGATVQFEIDGTGYSRTKVVPSSGSSVFFDDMADAV